MKEKASVGTQGLPNKPLPSGSAYVVIPHGIERKKYVKQCYKTNTISLRTEGGDFYKNAYIGDTELENVTFPEKISEQGSPVFWVCTPKHNTPVVVAVMNFKSLVGKITQENEIRLFKSGEKSVIDINGKSDDGRLSMSVTGTDEKVKFDITVVNNNNDAEYNLTVKGDVNIYASNKVHISTKGEEILIEFVDDALEAKAFLSYNPTDKWRIFGDANSAGEPVLLGDKTKTELDKVTGRIDAIITAISTSATAVNDGGLTYKTNMTASLTPYQLPPLLEDFSQIKSTKVKID